MSDYATVLSTAGSRDEAKRLARGLVEMKLAACVQMVPIESCYVWNGAIQEDAEVLLLIKTRRACFPDIRTFVEANHSYDTPELICLDIVDGTPGYLDWVGANTSDRN